MPIAPPSMQNDNYPPGIALDLRNATTAIYSGDRARGVLTALGAGTFALGVYTATANGAMAAQDGLTIAVGDTVLILEGTTNLTNAYDGGPYVVTSLGSAGSQVVLTRPAWWAHGATVQPGAQVHVAAGTLWANTFWKSCVAAAVVVGTTATQLIVGRVSVLAQVLVAGTKTLSGVPLLASASVVFNRTTANTTALTIWYNPITLTPGAIGTASLVVNAQVAAGTINAADISTLTVTIVNW